MAFSPPNSAENWGRSIGTLRDTFLGLPFKFKLEAMRMRRRFFLNLNIALGLIGHSICCRSVPRLARDLPPSKISRVGKFDWDFCQEKSKPFVLERSLTIFTHKWKWSHLFRLFFFCFHSISFLPSLLFSSLFYRCAEIFTFSFFFCGNGFIPFAN